MANPFNLYDKKVLVTGASSGIGRGIAKCCSEQGAVICLTSRNLENLNRTRDLLSPGDHTVYCTDLSIEAEVQALGEQLPSLDGIVLNAGMVKTMPVQYIKSDLLNQMFSVNITSSILLIQNLLKRGKINKGASICLISSVSSNFAQYGNSVYSATKGAVNSFTRGLALEVAPKGIRVNAILPGFVQTDILKNSAITEENLNNHLKNFPLGRFGKPEDIGSLAVYLLSDESGWMTGSLLTIDGGYSIK